MTIDKRKNMINQKKMIICDKKMQQAIRKMWLNNRNNM